MLDLIARSRLWRNALPLAAAALALATALPVSIAQSGTLGGSNGTGSPRTSMRMPRSRDTAGGLGCLAPSDCNDNVPCTADTCVEGLCQNELIPGCVPCELSYTCPPVDVVFIMDTSGSMRDEASVLCTQVFAIGEELAQDGVTASINAIGVVDQPGGAFDCLFDTVVGGFGGTVPGSLLSCPFPNGAAPEECWGPATAIIAQNYPWTPGATRIIIPMSDEGPCNGSRPDGCNDPGDDRESVENAIAVALANDVHVSPIAGTGADSCVINLGTALAKGTGGELYQLKYPKSEFRTALLEVIHATCLSDAQCDDHDACTQQDTCVEGRCLGQATEGCRTCIDMTDCDDQDFCTTDSCVDGFCSWAPNYNENECCDPVTGTTTPISDGDPCTQDVCDVETGQISHLPGPAGVPCDDGLVCTIQDQCDPAGSCSGTDANTQPCSSDVDCQGAGDCDLTSGFCFCSDTPSLCLDLQIAPGATCVPSDQMISVEVNLGASPNLIAGGQFFIFYDSSKLDFVEIVPGHDVDSNSIFEVELSETVDEDLGTILYSVAAAQAGVGTNQDALMAMIRFLPRAACGMIDAPCFTEAENVHTFLVNKDGGMVVPTPCCGSGFKLVADEPVLTCPSSVAVNAEPDRASAEVTWSAPVASSICDGGLEVHCEGVNPFGGRIDSQAASGGRFAFGLSTFHCSVTDSCGKTAECDWSVNVSEQQSMAIDIVISAPMTPLLISRCIELELFTDCLHSPLVIQQPVLLGGLFNFPGTARFAIKVPAAQYRCITARDPLHTLRSYTMLDIVDNQYVAKFKGDPKLGGNWLENGDLNGDGIIDVADYVIFQTQYNSRLDPNTECEGDAHADLNGDGVVDFNDLVFIERGQSHVSQTCCSSQHAVTSPITSLNAEQLNQMGVSDWLRLDMNSDSVIDYLDIVAFLDRVTPKDASKGSR